MNDFTARFSAGGNGQPAPAPLNRAQLQAVVHAPVADDLNDATAAAVNCHTSIFTAHEEDDRPELRTLQITSDILHHAHLLQLKLHAQLAENERDRPELSLEPLERLALQQTPELAARWKNTLHQALNAIPLEDFSAFLGADGVEQKVRTHQAHSEMSEETIRTRLHTGNKALLEASLDKGIDALVAFNEHYAQELLTHVPLAAPSHGKGV